MAKMDTAYTVIVGGDGRTWHSGRDLQERKVSFGIKDERGREIGADIDTGVTTFRLVTQEEWDSQPSWGGGYYTVPAGDQYWYCPQATRNGKKYGALQRQQFFPTAAERDAAVEKYLANAKKRAAKKAPK